MANVHFLRKFVADELRDTLYFGTGERAVKTKFPTHVELKNSVFVVEIKHTKYIKVNKVVHKSISQAKRAMQTVIENL